MERPRGAAWRCRPESLIAPTLSPWHRLGQRLDAGLGAALGMGDGGGGYDHFDDADGGQDQRRVDVAPMGDAARPWLGQRDSIGRGGGFCVACWATGNGRSGKT